MIRLPHQWLVVLAMLHTELPLRAVQPQVALFSIERVSAPALSSTGYQTTVVNNTDGSVEHRCYFHSQHFLSVLRDPLGAFAIRMHPGVDVNGWGTTVYFHPHLSGIALTDAIISSVNALSDRVTVNVGGPIKNASGTGMGTWTVALQFTCDPLLKAVSGAGTLSITRTQALSAGQDIDVVKIASNFLQSVPLLTGGTGNTGDTTGAIVSGSTLALQTWDPSVQPGHFPQDHCDWIDITLPGCYNIVDTARQPDAAHPGQYLEPIAAAYKPATRVRFDLQQSGQDVPFIFGASFDTGHATEFDSDNISVTPQIRHFATPSQFDFVLNIESDALPEDANKVDATLGVAHPSAQPVMDVLFSDSLAPGSWLRVGSLKNRGDGSFSATVKIPDGSRGFVKAQVSE